MPDGFFTCPCCEGDFPMEERDIQQFVNHLENQKDKSKPLNPKTVKNVHGVLHSALQQAFRIAYLKVNPATLTILPKRTKAEITPLQDEQVTQFLCAIKGLPFENIYLVDLFTGIRQSEIIGLKWDDIDFEHGNITIRRQLQFVGNKHGGYCFTTPKNNKPRQIIPAKFVMEVFHSQRCRQSEMRLAVNPAWNNSENLVFTNELGTHLKHDHIYRHLKRIFLQMGIPKLRFHDLRHSYAVLSIQALKTVRNYR